MQRNFTCKSKLNAFTIFWHAVIVQNLDKSPLNHFPVIYRTDENHYLLKMYKNAGINRRALI